MLRRLFNVRRRIRGIFYRYYNIVYFKLSGVVLGRDCKIVNKVYVNCHPSAKIIIGDSTTIFSGDNIIPLLRNATATIVAAAGSIIKIGNHCGLSNPCIWATQSITIGDNVLIGANCSIMDSDFHSIDYCERVRAKHSEGAMSSPIVIGDGAWIGCNTLIFKGVKIGKRSVIGGGSIVTHDIPSDCIAAGNPCKVIRYLDNSD